MAKCGWKESGTKMRRRWASLLIGLASLSAPGLVLAQQPPVIRINVNLVRVVATVKTQAGELVGALRREDFQVFDNGAPQEVAVFERQTDQPLSVALMVDTSGSTAKELKFETDSASRFLKALLSEGNAGDMVALYTFNWEIWQNHYFTHNYTSLANSLKNLRGDAGTSLYDAIYLVAHDLEDREGRKVMIVVTDGGDTTSAKTLKQALEATQLADGIIYPVVVMPITNDAGRNIGGENALTFMAEGTGGRTFLPSIGPELDRAFMEIIDELRTQYVLGFYPKNVPLTKDRFHKIEVKVRRPDLRVSARNGYYGEAEGTSGTPDARISVTPEQRKKRQEK
jgi:Ca-activated chloride channel family protein